LSQDAAPRADIGARLLVVEEETASDIASLRHAAKFMMSNTA
jgi:hypothetical protein